MPPTSVPKRAMRFSQRMAGAWAAVRCGSKLASTNTVLQSAAAVRLPSTAVLRPLLARTGRPSTETTVQSNTGACDSQLATNRGSMAAASPRFENSGITRKPTLRTTPSTRTSTSVRKPFGVNSTSS